MKALFALSCAGLLATPAFADCVYPAAPSGLPDGRTATLEQMVAGQKTVQEYDKAIKEYVDCIDHELEASIAKAGDSLKPQQKNDMQKMEAQKHNAAIDQLQSVADRFNEQVKAYKARTADKK
ncbi:MAG: hypothetical protein JOZ67_07305 [Gammaproteobacteria bacterium]|nr:hypothetical protein [Gammaproteobacteria bacterium]MBV9697003.1 hypothetical protein [Gammaproteobacteria bacterium]